MKRASTLSLCFLLFLGLCAGSQSLAAQRDAGLRGANGSAGLADLDTSNLSFLMSLESSGHPIEVDLNDGAAIEPGQIIETGRGATPVPQLLPPPPPPQVVSVPLLSSVCPGSEVTVPITVDSTNGVISMDFKLNFDHTVVVPTNVILAAITSGCDLEWNVPVTDELDIAIVCVNPLTGSGPVASVYFQGVGAPMASTPLTWLVHDLNEGGIPSTSQDGAIDITSGTSTLSMPNGAGGGSGGGVNIPVIGSLAPGAIGINAVIHWDPTVLTAQTVTPGSSLPGDWTVDFDISTPGTATLSMYGTTPLSGSQILADMIFDAIGDVGDQTVLDVASASVNEVPACVDDGLFTTLSGQVVSLPPSSTVCQGEELVIPISVDSADGVISMDFLLQYDPLVVLPTNVVTSALTNGCTLDWNISNPGQLAIAISCLTPLSGSGPVAYVFFQGVGAPGSMTALTWLQHDLNEGAIPSSSQGGQINITSGVTVISMPDTANGTPGSMVDVPITASPADGYLGVDLEVHWDPAVLTAQMVSGGPSLPGDWIVSANLSTPGVALIAASGPTPLSGMQTLVVIKFLVVGSIGTQSPLDLVSGIVNEGAIASCLDDGFFIVCPVCDDGIECTVDACVAGQCTHTFAATGTACGSPTDTDCDNPDTCNATGMCQANNAANGTACTTDGNDCTSDVCGAGVCTHPNVLAGTACGSPTDTDCDNPDTCNATGMCQANNETNGASCTTDGNDCTSDVCGAGVCTHPNVLAGTACGSPTDTDCDNPDTCNATGVCQANNETNGTACTTDGNDCTSDVCGAGVCTHPNVTAGTACGSPSDTDCDNPDTCNAVGMCQINNETNGTACTTDGNDCTSDVCGAGVCTHPNVLAGTACGSATDTDCDNPDTCNATGMCQANNETNGTACTTDGNDCTNDVCGSGLCTHANSPVTTPCNDGLACTDQDACDGLGNCMGQTVTCHEQPVDNACTNDTCVEPTGCMHQPICNIVGHIYYDKLTPAGPNPPNAGTDMPDTSKPIQGATVKRTSNLSPDATDVTDAGGQYEFLTDSGGNVTLAPQSLQLTDEDECANTFSAQDATNIAKYSVLLLALSPVQQVAADVSGNGTISSFDASLVAQKVVSIPCVDYQFPVSASDWGWVPASKMFTPLLGTENYDFVAILFGDVTVNWTSLPLQASTTSTSGGIAEFADRRHIPSLELTQASRTAPASTGAIMYVAQTPHARPDGLWDVVLGLQNADGILGLDMALRSDPRIATIKAVASVGLASVFSAVGNTVDGEYVVALYSAEPMQGTGEFLVVTYELAGSINELPFQLSAIANEGAIHVTWPDGPVAPRVPRREVDGP